MILFDYSVNFLRISVIIPTKNRIDMLKIALNSIFTQTYPVYEIIVIDDGSDSDDIIDLIRVINEPKVSLLRNHSSKGANYSRNRGIKVSTGDFIAFLDDDDYWLPQKLEKQLAVFKSQDVGAVYCGLNYYDVVSGKKKNVNRLSYPSGYILEQLLIEDITSTTPTYIVRRDCFDKAGFFDENLPARQDWDMWIRIAQHYNIGCVPEVLVYAGEHSGDRISIRNYQKQIEANILVYEKYNSLRSQFNPVIEKRASSVLSCHIAGALVNQGRYLKGFISYINGIKKYPCYFGNYSGILKIIIPIRLKLILKVIIKQLTN